MTEEVRKTIRFTASDLEAIALAQEKWPEHGDNFSSLIKAVLADWKRTKASHGKSAMLQHIIASLEQMNARLAAIEQQSEKTR